MKLSDGEIGAILELEIQQAQGYDSDADSMHFIVLQTIAYAVKRLEERTNATQ